MVGKIALIPWFGFNAFLAMVLFLGGIIIPINWFGLPVLLIMNLLMLMITSLHSILGINSFYKKNHMPLKRLLIVMQCFFVTDVFGVIIAFIQCKRKYTTLLKEKNCI